MNMSMHMHNITMVRRSPRAQLGYSDFFDAVDLNLVQLPNGTYVKMGMEEYVNLRKAGRIKTGNIDRLIGEDGLVAEAGVLPAGDGAAAASGGSARQQTMAYDGLKAALDAKRVEGVIFQPGSIALALMKDDVVAKVDIDKAWKRAELARVLERQGLPTNLNE
jgi:hypothetical protein